jgi:hypothetical protein
MTRAVTPARALPSVLLSAWLFASPMANEAFAEDYDLDEDRWNGLGYLMTTAEEARVTLRPSASIDLATLEPEDVLVLLYPTMPLPVADLLSFVRAGGYVVLADDQGSSVELVESLGLMRHETGPSAQLSHWDQQEGFALLRPAGEHFLFYNVSEVVANYPASFTISRTASGLVPILSYDGGREHFAVEAAIGGGKILLLADPSIFLNEMLRRFYGDKQFVANALRLYCQREPCGARLVMPEATWSGRFDAERARLGGLPKEVEARIAELNEVLAELSAAAATPPYAIAIAGLLLVLLALLVARVRGGERVGRGGLLPSVPSQISSPALDEARGLVAQRSEADFSHLALTLGEFALERSKKADLPGIARQRDDDGARDELRAALLRVEAETASLRSRQPPIWSADRFVRLHDDVQVLLRYLPAAGRHRRDQRPRTR